MAYSADISRNNPACFLFLVDQSASMSEGLAGQPDNPKSKMAADTINRTLDAITQRCSQGDSVRDYFEIGVIGYTTDPNSVPIIRSIFQGKTPTTPERPFLPISEIAELPRLDTRNANVSDGQGGLVQIEMEFPVWLEPEAIAGTPMQKALSTAVDAVTEWASRHTTSYPPIVIHVTDGESNDGDPSGPARDLMNVTTDDGNVLVFNVHFSQSSIQPTKFPNNSELLTNEYARMLYNMSSPLPESSLRVAADMGMQVSQNSRGFVLNADVEALVQFLDIGTRGATSAELR